MFKTATLVALVAAVSALVCCRPLPAGEAQTPGSVESGTPTYQDLLFLGDGRPTVIRLYLEVDGQPFESVWRDYARRLFTLADRDGDGRLSADEWQSPAESDDPLRGELLSVLSLPGLAQADLRPPDGALSFDEFAAFVSRDWGGPFQPPPVVPTVADNQRQAAAGAQNSNAGRVLFETLDANRDGRISPEELQAGPESIHKLDFDGDGASSIDELDHLRGPFGAVPQTPGAESAVPLRALSSGIPTSKLIETVVAKYGRTSALSSPSLAITQLGYRDEEMADFDADGNGRLDRDELRYWLTHPKPDVELVVRIGKRDEGQEPVVVKTPPTREDLTVKTSDLGLVSVVSGDVHLEIGVAPDQRNEESVRQSFKNRFRQSDRDGNGYLERDEVSGNPMFEGAFNRFDRDGDGKVFEEEMFAVVDGQIIASLSRTGFSAANRGKDLFEILDTNRDRRISRRELLAAVGRFDLWDTDGDGRLDNSEVPQLYQLVFDRGTPKTPGTNGPNQPASFAMRGMNVAGNGGPGWFHKMDRNGDGDVSRNEFVGTPGQFEQLDADGNGLVDAEEALAGVTADPK